MSIHTAAAAAALPRLPVSWKEFGELLRASQSTPRPTPKQEPVEKIGAYEKTRVSDESKDSYRRSESNHASDSPDVLDLSHGFPESDEWDDKDLLEMASTGLSKVSAKPTVEDDTSSTLELNRGFDEEKTTLQIEAVTKVDSLDIFA